MITVHCSPAHGITVTGTSRADGSNRILGNRSKGGLGLKWGSYIDAWYVPHTRDKHNSRNRARVEEIAAALRAAGHEAAVEYSDDTRTTGDAESELYAPAEARADAYETFASNAAGRANRHHATAHQATAGIPLGQPILVGHHSQRRHEKALEKSDTHTRKAFAEEDRARYWASRANAAAHLEEHRTNPAVTLRRIEKYEAEQRAVRRALDGVDQHGRPTEEGPARGEYRERLLFDDNQLFGKLAYWRGIVAEAEAAGVKIWAAADFTKGDFVLYHGTWWEVYRVNAKSLTIPWGHLGVGRRIIRKNDAYDWHGQLSTDTDRLGYDRVQGRMSAAEAAEKYPPTPAT